MVVFRVGVCILGFLIYVGVVLLCIQLGYEGLIWLVDFFEINSGFLAEFEFKN